MPNDHITVKEAKEKAGRLCSRKEYCSKEIYEKIISWGCTPEESQTVVAFLTEQKFIDDRRYTAAFVKDKLRFNKWGRIKIMYMLRMQGIDESVVWEALSEVSEGEYEQILTTELKKKIKTGLSGNIFEVKSKLFRFAASRGFEPDVINVILQKLIH